MPGPALRLGAGWGVGVRFKFEGVFALDWFCHLFHGLRVGGVAAAIGSQIPCVAFKI